MFLKRIRKLTSRSIEFNQIPRGKLDPIFREDEGANPAASVEPAQNHSEILANPVCRLNAI